jgi:hypothetical protein
MEAACSRGDLKPADADAWGNGQDSYFLPRSLAVFVR